MVMCLKEPSFKFIYLFIYFDRQTEQVLLTKNLKGNPKVYREYTGEDQAYTKRGQQTIPTTLTITLRECTKECSPLAINPAQEISALTKEVFNLESEKTASSKITLFLSFQIA